MYDLHLAPRVGAAAGLVDAVESLGDHALHAELLGSVLHGLAVADRGRRRLPGGSGEREPLEQLASVACTAARTWSDRRARARRRACRRPGARRRASAPRTRSRPACAAGAARSWDGPSSSRATISPSSTTSVCASASPSARSSRKRDVASLPEPRRERELAAFDDEEHPHAVPLHLERPSSASSRGKSSAAVASIGLQVARHGFARGVGGRAHAVDHPLVALGLEQRVLAVDALAVERDDHLVVAQLLGFVRARVPDRHRARAVLARRGSRRGT